MNRNSSPFKWRHYAPDVVLLCVRWYCRFRLSYRGIEEMVRERGLDVDYSTVFRRVRHYAPDINKRIRPHLKMGGTSYGVDETYIKAGKSCKYLYRAVDEEGRTIEFMLGANRDVSAAKRFFKKKARASQCFKSFHTAERTPEGIESIGMTREGQVKRLAGSDSLGQAKFVAGLFGVAA
jgi:transposase-like protein